MATSKITALDEDNTCKLCDDAVGKYVCPKCNTLYCSVLCYQSEQHRNCSEQFYRDNVLEEMKQNEDNALGKSRMLEILQKVHDSNILDADTFADTDIQEGEDVDSDDSLEIQDIAERLANVDLDNAEKVWEKLTEDERKEFAAFLQSEDVTKLIPPWKPWWSYYIDSKVQEINTDIDGYKNRCPSIECVGKFTDLCKKQPPGSVKLNLINIMAGYAFTTRYFNGECADFPREVISCLGSIALSLKCHQDYENFEFAVKSVEQECLNIDWIVTDAENISAMREDLDQILRGPTRMESKFYVECALADIHNLLKKALQMKSDKSGGSFAKHFPNAHFPEVKLHSSSRIKVFIKRVEYFLSYVHNFFDH
ncbi:hypothetical protein WA026_011165 [Henosepilachna vigintioctopunctata]|uniref:HIT-type domain-containing protein n=1 Tax=Henosepilachna vigintioctopunctata TaxID=420089 RepID=A0AAW1U0K5_9CUCU